MAEKTLDEVYENWYTDNKMFEELIKEVQIISFPKVVNLIKKAFKGGYNIGYAESKDEWTKYY